MKPMDVLMIADCLRLLAAALDDGAFDPPVDYRPSRIRELADQLEADGLGDLGELNRLPMLYHRLLVWYNSRPRKSATQAFTSSTERQIAYLIEMAEREAVAAYEAAQLAPPGVYPDWRRRLDERLKRHNAENPYTWDPVGDDRSHCASDLWKPSSRIATADLGLLYGGHDNADPDKPCHMCGRDPAAGPFTSWALDR